MSSDEWKGLGTIVGCILGAVALIIFGWFLARADWDYRESQIFREQAVTVMVQRDKLKDDYDRQASVVYELDKENKRLAAENFDLNSTNAGLQAKLDAFTAVPTSTPRPAPQWGGPGDRFMDSVIGCSFPYPPTRYDLQECLTSAINTYLRETGRQ